MVGQDCCYLRLCHLPHDRADAHGQEPCHEVADSHPEQVRRDTEQTHHVSPQQAGACSLPGEARHTEEDRLLVVAHMACARHTLVEGAHAVVGSSQSIHRADSILEIVTEEEDSDLRC